MESTTSADRLSAEDGSASIASTAPVADHGQTGPSSPSTSPSSTTASSSVQLSERRPPDGGWGWVVVGASFFVNLIADGVTFSFGIMFRELLDYFEDTKSKTALIGSVIMAMPLLSGPVASYLTGKYGCRSVTVAGAILATVGYAAGAFATSVEQLFLAFATAGFGLSLCYVAAVVIVAYYFEKRRSFATGLSVCGSGIGTLIFAPLVQYLIHEFGWRGATLLIAGAFLNMCVCGALMRPLPWTSRSTLSRDDSDLHVPERRLCNSLLNLPTFVGNREKVPPEVLELLQSRRSAYRGLLHQFPGLIVTPSRSLTDVPAGKHISILGNGATGVVGGAVVIPMARPQHPRHRALLDQHRLSLTYRGAMLNIHRYRMRATSCPDISAPKPPVVSLSTFGMLAEPRFLIFVISNFLLYGWYDVPYVYLTDMAEGLGHSETRSSVLLSAVGLANMLGEVALGWAGDRPRINVGTVYAGCMVLCGAAVSLTPLMADVYTSLITLSSLFGLFISANYALTSILLVQMISLERFTSAYGILLLVQGVANLLGPPLAGLLSDWTLSYDLAFYLAGLFIAISGILLLLMPARPATSSRCSSR